jgi:hypothetical protein
VGEHRAGRGEKEQTGEKDEGELGEGQHRTRGGVEGRANSPPPAGEL